MEESNSFLNKVRTLWHELIDLKPGLDKEGTIRAIVENKHMQGANAWLLMCSIVIASVGLDISSPAVIIGAMLISPLMAPILGIGLGIGINDRQTLLTSSKHFLISIAIALTFSTGYFIITPLGDVTHEILSRTKPTLLDAIIALFGGLAGIISGSRKDISNAIPGVAIATALMPPLCVCGFGISKLFKLAFGSALTTDVHEISDFIFHSFYLFFLNSALVAFATWAIVKYLRFPVRKFIDPKTRRRTTRTVMGIALIALLPSIPIMIGVVRDVGVQRKVSGFIKKYIAEEEKFIDGTQVVEDVEGRKLIIKVYGNALNESQEYYERRLSEVGLRDTRIEIIRTSEIDLEKFQALENRVMDVNTNVSDRLRIAQSAQFEKEIQLQNMQAFIDSLSNRELLISETCLNVPLLIPEIERVYFSAPKNDSLPPAFFYKWSGPSDRQMETEINLRKYLERTLRMSSFDLNRF